MNEIEGKRLEKLTSKYFPEANSEIQTGKICIYTYSPDTDFIIDYLPGHQKKVVFCTGFSGHGFKFSPTIGDAIAHMIVTEERNKSIELLSFRSFDLIGPES